MKKTLGGFVCIRDGDLLDYCWRESVNSLLAVCDEVVICDCDSSDGTRQIMDKWAADQPKVTLANFPWTDPKGDPWWYPNWLNYARQHLKLRGPDTCVVYLDGDEILHEDSYAEVRNAADQGLSLICRRFNFWRDAQSLIPDGKCCGHEVIRVGPRDLWFPSDYPDPRANEIMRRAGPSNIQIMHYGFLRSREAFFRKAREVQRIWANDFDPRLVAAEKFEGVWSTMPGVTGWENNLVPFTGTHPKLIHRWLLQRGYDPYRKSNTEVAARA